MALEIVLVIVGLALLLGAGDLLVRGAVSLAAALRVPSLLISLTIVAFGTSAPELVVTIQAIFSGNDGIALGNIVGSNIANIFLVLGLPAIVYPMSTHVPGLRRHGVVLFAATAYFAFLAFGPGAINLQTGGVLFACIVIYLLYMWFRAHKAAGADPILDDVEEFSDGAKINAKTLLFIAAGLIGLPLGAQLLVINGAEIAANLGVREEIVGLTIIAFGTSLPELATVIAAALHRKSDVAIGGVIGSNIFNTLAVGGAAGLAGGATFNPAALSLEIPVMLIATAILCLYVFARRDVGRISGVVFFAGYLAFIYFLAVSSGI